MNYSDLLDAINDAIYENNEQEIDALDLRGILREMVTSLGSGYLFKGIATPSSPTGTGTYEPDQNVFYLATTAGTYTYLGGLVVAAGEVAFLCYDGTWTKKSSALLSTGSIVDNLTTNDATKVLSAKQGKVLADAGAATAAEVSALGQEIGTKAGVDNSRDVAADLEISDELGATLARFKNGNFRTKNFDSENIGEDSVPDFDESQNYVPGDLVKRNGIIYRFTQNHSESWDIGDVERVSILGGWIFSVDKDAADLEFADQAGNVLVRFKDGHIRTKNFDSENILPNSGKNVVVVMFMGQSNMAGRGVTSSAWPQTAPAVIDGAGYEFRAISDPSKLYPISEPFGVAENKSGGINDGNMKTGGPVSAFVNSHFKIAKKPIIGVSASEGGTSIQQWLPSGSLLPDAISRLSSCLSFLNTNGYSIDNVYMVWCQGETDGDNGTTKADYKSRFLTMWGAMKTAGVQRCFIVRIGQYNGTGRSYDTIIEAQDELCKELEDVVMINAELYSFKALGLMKDSFHYYQEGYNRVGTHSGGKIALYESMQSDPIMYDPKALDLFYTDKSL